MFSNAALLNLVGTGSSAIAVVVTVVLFLKYLKSSHEQDSKERELERNRLFGVLVNDLAHVTESLKDVHESLTCVKRSLDEVVRRLDRS